MYTILTIALYFKNTLYIDFLSIRNPHEIQAMSSVPGFLFRNSGFFYPGQYVLAFLWQRLSKGNDHHASFATTEYA
jgi:hypothetical protein